MTRYATMLGRDPEAVYRQIDLGGRTAEADPHQLVELLYDELLSALRVVAWAIEHRQFALKSEKATRSIAILFALESGLDFDLGGDVSRSLGALYRAARRTIIDASLGTDPAPFRDVARNLGEIAGAWASIRPAGSTRKAAALTLS